MSTNVDHTAPYLAQFAEGPAGLSGADAWPDGMRQDAIRRFAETGFPTTRVEDWHFTNIDRLARTGFQAATPADLSAADIEPALLGGVDAYRLVFVNGVFASGLSLTDGLPGGVTLTTLAHASESEAEWLSERLGAVAPLNGQSLVALNTALSLDGPVFRIDPGVALDKPVQVVHFVTAAEKPVAVHPRCIIAVGEGGRATVVESFTGAGAEAYWTNAVTEIDVGANARLDYLKLQEERETAYHVGMTRVRLARDAVFDGFVLSTGAALARNEIRVAVEGEGAECFVNGGSLVRGRQHSDITTEIDHRVPHGHSAQVIKSVVDDRARSVFQGRVVVAEKAQKTDAHQSNRNLLLSPRAQADAKPELKIFADDVKCSHGATVGDLDRDALFYLLSRGIDPASARRLLIEAFVGDLLDRIGDEAIRADVSRRLSAWLASDVEQGESAA